MSGFGDDDISGEEVNVGGREDSTAIEHRARRLRSLTMFDNIRTTMYLTMAGMIDSGLDMPTAAAILAEEYAAEKMDDASASVTMFFESVHGILSEKERDPKAAAAKIGEVAFRSFGEKFVGPEEMALLKALSISGHPARLFSAIAGLLSQYERERAAGAVASFRRAVG